MPKVEPHSRIFSMAAALDGGFGGVVTGGPSSVLRVCDDALNECQRPAASSQHRFLGKAPGKVEKAIINRLASSPRPRWAAPASRLETSHAPSGSACPIGG